MSLPNSFPTPPPRTGDRPLSRRRLLSGAAALAGGGLLLGCAPGARNSAEELTYWHLMTGGDGTVMAGLVDAVNAMNAGFRTTQTVLAWGPPYYTKLAMASAGGRAPDLAIMHASRIAGYAPGGLLEPWDLDLLAELGVRESDFPPLVWQKGLYDGQLYSIALDTHPFVLYYNTEHAAKAGVADAIQTMDSPEAFTEVARKLQRVTGKHGLSYGYLGDGSQMWRLFYTFYRQTGAEMKLVPGSPAQVDEAAAVEALSFVRSLLDDTIATRSGDGGTATSEFLHGESGMFFGGVWELPVLKDAKLPFDARPIPTLFGQDAAYADSHTFVLPRQSKVSPERRRHVYQLVAEILKHSVVWAGAGHIPAYQPVVRGSEYQQLKPQSNYAGIPAYVNYDPDAWFGGAGSDFHKYFAENVQNVYLGSGDPAAGFEGFVQRLNKLLDRPQPV
ncbi:multiple sugar transport system substrate-binding protein [Kribbella sp. VKM Ac-2527]|uniref:Multiple sugar transport system substrate-binding protein n=1 Tax=Kribbella caucasensis TaxID=2512215 RepID=A0A4R6JD10_9ACTN|nr:extracellular solute-binding protein [Kribbella sp. VKM Ac-2527]TDO33247.1 multiple sugar transport system substrate-binding protein [Kribbella sp. VKM Ac-2527]